MRIRNLLAAVLRTVIPNVGLIHEAKWEAKALLRHFIRGRATRKRFRGKRGILANIGCGPRPIPGWENLDLVVMPGITCWDCRRGMPFEDSSVSVIFSEHMYEHLDRPHASAKFLAECLRCMEPGGLLRLVVPDAEMYLDAYAARDWEPFVAKRPLQPRDGAYHDPWLGQDYQTRMEVVNSIFRQGTEHKFAYDAETLILDLTRAGFSFVIHQDFGKSVMPALIIDRPERATESLYVEALK